MALDIQKSPEDISTKTETAPSRAPERGYQILGDAPEAQAAYITRMDALAEEKSKAEKQATAATTPEAKAEAQDAIDEAVLSQARESRMTFIRTHGGLDSDSAENRTKRQTLLKNRGSFDEVLPSDLYALSYTSGYDLVPLLMYNVWAKSDRSPSAADLAEGDKLMTNFGKNSRVNAVVGCADILPPEIEQVRIDGKLGIRLSGNPILDKAILARNGMSADAISGVRRPGYYSVDSGGNCTYMPVYHRTEVEIVKRYNNLTDEERRMHRESAYTRYRDMRIEDMLEAGDALSDTEEDQKLKQEMGDIVERRRKLRERYGRYGNAMKEQEFMNVPAFGGTVREACRAFGIPEAALLRLMYKESGFNPHARPRNSDGSLASSAYGLGQHLNSTWQTCAQTLVPNYAQSLDINALKSVGAIESADELRPPYFDRENPVHQIIATAAYLRHVRDLRGCDWGTAIVFYHTGPYFAQKHVAAALAANDGMIKFNPMLRVSPTLENYLAAARKFYGVDDLGGQQTS